MNDVQKQVVFETIKKYVRTEIEPTDLISVSDAANLAASLNLEAKSISGIMRKMERGDLPTYQLGDLKILGVDLMRMTSRKAVMALPKAKGERVHSQKKVYSPSYGTLLPLRTILMSVFAPFNRFSFS